MPFPRDPLSVHYDGYVHQLMLRAARASTTRHSVRAWISSPSSEYAHLDHGGRTVHERAFTRSAYYLVDERPNHRGSERTKYPAWSLKLVWSEEVVPSRRGRHARAVLVRLYPRGQARVARGTGWVGTGRQAQWRGPGSPPGG
jgi:hypothetical protein